MLGSIVLRRGTGKSHVSRKMFGFVAALAAITLSVGVLAPAGPAFADVDSATLSQSKSVVDAQASYEPGDTFQYEIQVGCSSTNDPACYNAVLTDALPAPLVLDPSDPTPVSAATNPSAPVDIALNGNTGFTVRPSQAPGGQPGLRAGGSMTVFVSVLVPTTTSGEFNGRTITNTSIAVADNALQVEASADVTLVVSTTLLASLTKSASPTSTIPAAPGRTVDWTLVPGNASNQTVDTITVQDPTTPPGPFGYLDITGVDIVEPAGATGHTTQYFVDGVWTDQVPDPISLAKGARVVFTGTFAPGVTGSVVVHSVTNDTVTTIPDGQSVSVVNDASTSVSKAGTQSPQVTDDAAVTIAAQDPDVAITKTFADSTLVAGQSTVALITATNGAQDVQRLTVTEPSAGQPGFTAQGLQFTGFGNALAWPDAATSATITYTYADCTSAPLTTTTSDTLPAAEAGCTVEGFTVTFESLGDGIASASYAVLPLQVKALPVTTTVALSSTNFVDTEVVNSDAASGRADTSASFTVDPLRVGTVVSKSITPDSVYAVPGADTMIALSGKVSDDSTVGSQSLTISDPADPAASTDFWDAFVPTTIENTDIPQCSSLTVNYWSESAGAWTTFEGADAVVGPVQGWSFTIPTALRSDIGGIQFVFLPTCDETLPPGFDVLPRMAVDVRDYNDTEVVYTNEVQSEVFNPDAIVPRVTDDASDTITLVPIDDGPGPDFVDKTWLDPDSVPALSEGVRTARIGWSTVGLNITTMTLTDPASQGELDNVATSVYDAFDLVAIKPITSATDPLIVNDVVSKVELYSDSEDAWVDITSAACAAGCTGTFGGYTLTSAQQLDTLGVRVTLTERTAGAGVGASYDRRPFDLDFRVRDVLRSNPTQYVLGDFHPYTYNTSNAGLVNNTVNARAVNPSIDFDRQSGDSDVIQIIDSPINVGLTKTFDQDVLGKPADGTPAEDYPLISAAITATNNSATRVASMLIDDPAASQADPTVFDALNLYSIDTITAPSGLTLANASVTLVREGGTDAAITVAAAQALTPAELTDVIGVSVLFADAANRPAIAPAATGTVNLTWQLRSTTRSGGQPVEITQPGGEPLVNVAHTALDSPSRIPCPGDGCSTGEATASDSFNIVAADYSITTSKSINPSSVIENGSMTYVSSLRARSDGNARTYLMTVSDSTSTFWNTMDYVSSRVTVPRPVNQIAMDALVDNDDHAITYTVDAGTLVVLCDGVAVTDSSPCWVSGTWTSATPGSSLSLALPTGVTADQVVGVRYRAQQVEDGAVVVWERPYNPLLNYAVTTQRRETLRSDPAVEVSTTRPGVAPNPGETESGRITNTVVTDGDARFGAQQTFTDHEEATTSTLVTHQVNAIKVTKTRGSTPTVPSQSLIPYVMVVENTGQWDMTGFEVVDQITPVDGSSPLVEPDPARYTFSVTGTGAPSGSAGFSASLDETTGTLSIVNSDPDFVFKSGWTLRIAADLNFRPGLSPNVSVQNTVTATSDRDFERCESTTTNLVPKPLETNVAACSADTTVSPRASATVALKKWVKGDDAGDPAVNGDDDLGVLNVTGPGSACNPSIDGITDDGFYSYPCTPITRPGGEETWRLDFLNTGNTNAKIIATVDTLPSVGDRGVIVNSLRGSQFPVSLVGKVESNITSIRNSEHATVTAFFSTQVLGTDCNQNAIKVYTENATPSPSCDFGWMEFTADTPEAALTGARSIKYVVTFANPDATIPAPGLAPGETLSIMYNTRTPSVLPKETAIGQGISVAYNSFAGASRSVATATQSERGEMVLEPQKVGIATVTGQLQMQKTVEAPQFSVPIELPETYPLLVTCVSGGQTAALVYASGADASRPSVNADGGILIYDDPTGPVNLPLFADCTVIEDPVPAGVTSTINPATAVMADRDLSGDTRIWDGYSGDPQEAFFAITNEFTAGGFTVSKTVDNSGAVDQDGTPIQYSATFDFEASCTYLDQEALAEADQTFSLADGESKAFTGIPTGAECTVTETATGDAASTSVSLTEDGGEPVVTAGTTTQFTVGEGDATVTLADFVNTYTVGSIEIAKSVIGAGRDAWGSGPFEVQLVCTLDGAVTNPVYDATHELTRVGDTWTFSTWRVDNLPTGAQCAVSETDDAGATESTLDPESGTVTIGVAGEEGEIALVTVTNDFRVGGLNIAKVVTGPGEEPFGAGPFVFDVSCTYEDAVVYSGELSVVNDGSGEPIISDTITGIPVGAECTVTETDDGSADATPAPVTVTIPDVDEEGNPQVVTTDPFVNEFSAAVITLTKNLEGPGAEQEYATSAVFTVLVTCQLEGPDDTMVTLLSRSYGITGGETIELTDADGNPVRMPYGAHCFGDETATGGATTAVVKPDNYDDGLVVAADSELQTLALVATNTFDLGSLQLSKIVTGTAAADNASKRFLLSLTCSLDQGQAEPTILFDNEIVEITGGQTITVDDLPIGAECFVAETDNGGANAVTISHSTSAMPAVVTADGDAVITVTNTFTKPLPATGVDSQALLVAGGVALLLIIAGVVVMIVMRRRRQD